MTRLPSDAQWLKLTDIDFSDNKLTNFPSLVAAKELRSFRLSRINPSSLEGIQSFTALKLLFAEENALTDLRRIAALKKLEQLHISNNRIAAISPLIDLPELRYVKYLELEANPLDHAYCPIVGASSAVTIYCQHRSFDRN